MMKVSTPTLQMSAGGPTTSPFNISGAARGREGEQTAFISLLLELQIHLQKVFEALKTKLKTFCFSSVTVTDWMVRLALENV